MHFRGTIPEGQYGAGRVTIWDEGTYENVLASKPRPQTLSEGIEAGHLEVLLHGQKLKGRFALICLRHRGTKEHWLLIKMKDASASPVARPRRQASGSHAVEFTHVDKVMFPEVGLTKGDVLRFYEQIAERLLPHLRDRPATLERFPEGIVGSDAPHFWQKNTPAYYPAWIPRVDLPSEEGKHVRYVLVNDRETLLYLVNQGTLSFHVWLSHTSKLDRPDMVLFDLDPGKASFADVVTVARHLHGRLEAKGIQSFVKTSGKTGLHVLVPWTQPGDYDEARAWATRLARQVVADLPDLTTVEQRKRQRQGKVYVDVLQNARGHTAVPPYVLRAVPQATVSTPLAWNELTPTLDPGAFTVKTLFERLAGQTADPFVPLVLWYRSSPTVPPRGA